MGAHVVVLAKKIEIYSAALRIEAHFVGLRFVVFKVFLDPRVFMKGDFVCSCSYSASKTVRKRRVSYENQFTIRTCRGNKTPDGVSLGCLD